MLLRLDRRPLTGMLSHPLETARSYARSARYLALEPGRTWLGTWASLLWFRLRYGINPFYLAIFSIDGKWPENPGEYVQHRTDKVETVMRQMNPVSAYAAVDDKIEFFLRCKQRALPTPEIFTAIPGKSVLEGTGPRRIPVSRNAADLQERLEDLHEREFFCKPVDGINGKGGFAFKKSDGHYFRSGTAVAIESLFAQIQEAGDKFGGMIVQERLRLNPEMLPISPSGALSTARIVTCLEQGRKVRLVASILKICAGKNETDNFARGLTGNLIANIDAETGRLSAAIGSVNREFPLLRSQARHPDSGAQIEGFELPDWSRLLDLVRNAHLEFAEFWTLGWDIALTDRGPVLVEANPVWATAFLQTASRKGLRSEFVRWRRQILERQTESRRSPLPASKRSA